MRFSGTFQYFLLLFSKAACIQFIAAILEKLSNKQRALSINFDQRISVFNGAGKVQCVTYAKYVISSWTAKLSGYCLKLQSIRLGVTFCLVTRSEVYCYCAWFFLIITKVTLRLQCLSVTTCKALNTNKKLIVITWGKYLQEDEASK